MASPLVTLDVKYGAFFSGCGATGNKFHKGLSVDSPNSLCRQPVCSNQSVYGPFNVLLAAWSQRRAGTQSSALLTRTVCVTGHPLAGLLVQPVLLSCECGNISSVPLSVKPIQYRWVI